MISCKFCSKLLSRADSLKRHEKYCKFNTERTKPCTEQKQTEATPVDSIRQEPTLLQTQPGTIHDPIISVPEYTFHAPTTMAISGTTGSGKTSLLFRMLKNMDKLFSIPVKNIIWQPTFQEMEEQMNINFHHGIPSEEEVENFIDGSHKILILDDLMSQTVESSQVQHWFTVGSHHNNLTIIYINQNMFCQGKCAWTMNLNTHYMILLRNPRDISQISVLGKQIGMGKGLVEAYQNCVSKPYGYLLIDLSPHSDNSYRLKTNIFPNEDTVIYVPVS